MKPEKGSVTSKTFYTTLIFLRFLSPVSSALVFGIAGNNNRPSYLGNNGCTLSGRSSLTRHRFRADDVHGRNKCDVFRMTTSKTLETENDKPLENHSDRQSSAAQILRPPHPIHSLRMHETLHPFGHDQNLSITRIASDPDMFLVKNLLPEEREHLMKMQGMEHAETKTESVTNHRKNSYMTWIDPDEDDNDEDRDEDTQAARDIASYLRDISSYLFVPHYYQEHGVLLPDPPQDMDGTTPTPTLLLPEYLPEKLQLVKYTPGGKFDFHHDGFHRFLTVLTYLNGVAGTWFPYALVGEDELEEDIPIMTLEGAGMAQNKVPGRDGVVLLGVDDDYGDNAHAIIVQPGDAVVFYNYDLLCDPEDVALNQNERMMMNWRSLHAGLETLEEKWIATNWFQCDISEFCVDENVDR